MDVPSFKIATPAWHADALCAQTDPDSYFPEKGGSTREAKLICLRCDVQAQCLEAAIVNDERYGIWGGYSERERRRLKRGETFKPAVSNKPNRNANGHGHRCGCIHCVALKRRSA